MMHVATENSTCSSDQQLVSVLLPGFNAPDSLMDVYKCFVFFLERFIELYFTDSLEKILIGSVFMN